MATISPRTIIPIFNLMSGNPLPMMEGSVASMWVKVLVGGLIAAGVGKAIGEAAPVQSQPSVQAPVVVQARQATQSPKEVASAPEPVRDEQFEQAKDAVAALINLNGQLCAEPVDVRPLKVKSGVFEVTCIEYRGGKGKVRYLVDSAAGTASQL